MAISKALTTENIVPILKEAGFITKDNMVPILKEAGFATKDDVENSIMASEKRVTKKLIRKLNEVKRDLTQKIANLATTTPTYKEFKQLEQKIKSYV